MNDEIVFVSGKGEERVGMSSIAIPHTISESIKQEGVKGFMKRWKDGFQKIPPDKLLESEIVGYWGNIIGTIFACIIFMIWSRMWPLALVLIFNVVIQGSQLIGKYQQLKQMKDFKKQFEELNLEIKR
jgi:hypothetical protein